MAISGQAMILFVVFHLLGNSTIYFSWLNAYAKQLHDLPPLVWISRLALLTLFSFHVIGGIQLYLENRAAKPQGYTVRKNIRSSFGSRNMLWTGLVIGAFLVYHLLHFTIQAVNPASSAKLNPDALGRPDVYSMVVLNLKEPAVAGIYILAMLALFFHLSHSIQSSFQTLGLNNERTLSVIEKAGLFAAIILFIGYVSIPVFILIGIVNG